VEASASVFIVKFSEVPKFQEACTSVLKFKFKEATDVSWKHLLLSS
jgi:hypothetical protein